MHIPVLILGNTGSGKTYSIRNLDPATTVIITATKKLVPFPGPWREFNHETKLGNIIYATERPERKQTVLISIKKALEYVSASMLDVETIVVDDFQYAMGYQFLSRIKESGWERFNDIASETGAVMRLITEGPLRDNLTVFVLTHNELDDRGRSKMKTVGQAVDKYLTPEGMFTIVLETESSMGPNGGEYYFRTNGAPAKSPPGMFEMQEPNDLLMIKTKLQSFYQKEA